MNVAGARYNTRNLSQRRCT